MQKLQFLHGLRVFTIWCIKYVHSCKADQQASESRSWIGQICGMENYCMFLGPKSFWPSHNNLQVITQNIQQWQNPFPECTLSLIEVMQAMVNIDENEGVFAFAKFVFLNLLYV